MDLNTTIEVFNSLLNISQVEIRTRLIEVNIILAQHLTTGKVYALSKLYDIRGYLWEGLKKALPLILAIVRYILFRIADLLMILIVKWRNHLVVGTAMFLGAIYLWYQNANKTKYQVQALEQCYLDLAALISSKDCHPILLRLAWSDAATYDQSIRDWPRCGGANASIRFDRNLLHPSNAGLSKALQYLRPLKKKYRNISWADIIQMAGSLAVELAGGPSMQGKMRYGRIDAPVPPKSDSHSPNNNAKSPSSITDPAARSAVYELNAAASSPSRHIRDSLDSAMATPPSATSASSHASSNPTHTHTLHGRVNNVSNLRSNLFSSELSRDSSPAGVRASRDTSALGDSPYVVADRMHANHANHGTVGSSSVGPLVPKLPIPAIEHNAHSLTTARSEATEYTASGAGLAAGSVTARSSYSVFSQYTSARPATGQIENVVKGISKSKTTGTSKATSRGDAYGGLMTGRSSGGNLGYGVGSTVDRGQCEASRLPVAEPPYPDGVPTADAHIRHVFYRMGFKNKEIVALCGAHTLGRAFKDRSGVCEFASGDANATKYTNQNWCAKADGKPGIGMAGGCSWTKNWLQFDNSYFKRIHDLLNKSSTDAETTDLLWLSTDWALYKSSEFRPHFMRYAKDENAFFEDYSDAHKKMSELGAKFQPAEGITLSHIDIKRFINQ